MILRMLRFVRFLNKHYKAADSEFSSVSKYKINYLKKTNLCHLLDYLDLGLCNCRDFISV